MIKSMFFDSIGGDRLYNADDFSQYFKALLTDGVFPDKGMGLKVIPCGEMTVKINTGAVIIQGKVGVIDENPEIINIETADAKFKRMDLIVCRLDTNRRYIKITAIKGTPEAMCEPPDLSQEAGVFDIPLAKITINPAAKEIKETDITDLRNFVQAAFDPAISSGLIEDLKTWMEQAREILKEDKIPILEGNIKKLNQDIYDLGVLIERLDKNKMNAVEIVNDCTTGGENKVLSAEQGKVLFQFVDEGIKKVRAALIDRGVVVLDTDDCFAMAEKLKDKSFLGYKEGEIIPAWRYNYKETYVGENLRDVEQGLLRIDDNVKVFKHIAYYTENPPYAYEPYITLNEDLSFTKLGQGADLFLCEHGLMRVENKIPRIVYSMEKADVDEVKYVGLHKGSPPYDYRQKFESIIINYYFVSFADKTVKITEKVTIGQSLNVKSTEITATEDIPNQIYIYASASCYLIYYPQEKMYKAFKPGQNAPFFTNFTMPVWYDSYVFDRNELESHKLMFANKFSNESYYFKYYKSKNSNDWLIQRYRSDRSELSYDTSYSVCVPYEFESYGAMGKVDLYSSGHIGGKLITMVGYENGIPTKEWDIIFDKTYELI